MLISLQFAWLGSLSIPIGDILFYVGRPIRRSVCAGELSLEAAVTSYTCDCVEEQFHDD